MTTTIDTVIADAMKLSNPERAELIERLLATVLPTPPLHPSWEAEIERRVADLDAGIATSQPADEVFAKAQRLIAATTRQP